MQFVCVSPSGDLSVRRSSVATYVIGGGGGGANNRAAVADDDDNNNNNNTTAAAAAVGQQPQVRPKKMSIKKRDSRQYIVINEERLISEVQRRPILYDKALKGYRKPTIREHAWQEVANYLESTVEESKKRWRSLRDAFMKQYKQYSTDEPSSSKKKKWLFYDQMEFLRPYLEMSNDLSREEYMEDFIQPKLKQEYHHHGSGGGDDNSSGKANVIIQHETSGDDDGTEVVTEIVGEGEEVEQLEENDDNGATYDDQDIISEMFIPHITGSVTTTAAAAAASAGNETQTHTIVVPHHHHQHHQQQPQQSSHQQQANLNSSNHSNDEQQQQQQQLKEHSVEVTNVSTYGLDPDERFLLSCSPILKRLSHKKNALARLKMQQILYEIEFGEEMF